MPVFKIKPDPIPVVAGMKVKYKDIFDIKAFYEALFEWSKEYGWGDLMDSGGGVQSEHWETYYGERVDQKGSREIWFQWRLFKDPPHAPFLRYYLDMDFHVLGLSNAEIVREGMKIAANKGEIEITTNTFIEKRYEKAFSKSAFLKPITSLFTERVYRKELKQREKELYQETYALQNFMKQWFKLKRYLPYEEVKGFFPSYAWPSHLKE